MRRFSAKDIVPQTIRRSGAMPIEARITPSAGANLISFRTGNDELIHWDESGFLKNPEESFTGAFNMYPTPCRLDQSRYTFDGRTILQNKQGQPVFIHGLVRDEPFEYRNEGDRITSWIDVTEQHPVYEGFPWKHRFAVTHALLENGLEVRFRVENRDTRPLPFGYGIHPFWRIPGKRADVSIRIPCDNTLDLENLVPTGGYQPVAGTDMDLRTLRSIESLFVDNVFWPRKTGDTAEVVFRSIRKTLTIEASEHFPHMIVYAPKGRDFLCVENLTSTPNAPNLVSRGHTQVASMLVAKPGQAIEGWIRYRITTC